MRRARRSGALLLAGLVVTAAVPFAANLYLGGIVPQRVSASVPQSAKRPSAAPIQVAAEPVAPADPIEHVADFLSRASVAQSSSASAARARQADPEAPRIAPSSAEAPVKRERARAVEPQPRAARDEIDFLEREDFIY